MQIDCVPSSPAADLGSPYGPCRDRLAPMPLLKLPLGSVRPRGWLRHQLDLMVDGMAGRLSELSDFLADTNGWFGGDEPGWEEQPYWLRGAYPLAVFTGDARLRAEVDRWIETVISSQDDDGWFGARYHRHRTGANGQTLCDVWPHMLMLDALVSHHEATGDRRVPELMTRFFAFCRDLPDSEFIPATASRAWEAYREGFGDWKVGIQMKRAGDMIAPIHWLYDRTGDPWLLDVATRFHDHTLPPRGTWLDEHIVHFTQRFAYAGIYARQTGFPAHRAAPEFWYHQHMATWGQQPRGMFAADERTRPGKVDPRYGFETCGFVEFSKNFALLGRITGESFYADRCEDLMLNHFPAAQTPDLKGLHYVTASNCPQLDAACTHDFFNEKHAAAHNESHPQLLYTPHRFRCCQHNTGLGWPLHIQNLWQATADRGLALWMYGACEVDAKVGAADTPVRIVETTDYPFRDRVDLEIAADTPVRFPLYLRVPGWCRGMTIVINGAATEVDAVPGRYVRIDREWSAGDRVEIRLPMETALTHWPRTGAATVDRGPLSYSVRIEEDWRRCGGTDDWPEWEVFPTTPWNYALDLGDGGVAGLEVTEPQPVVDQPWTIDAAPVEIRVPARRLPGWELENNMIQELPVSPVTPDTPRETVRLVPLGCARLRVSCLPVVNEA